MNSILDASFASRLLVMLVRVELLSGDMKVIANFLVLGGHCGQQELDSHLVWCIYIPERRNVEHSHQTTTPLCAKPHNVQVRGVALAAEDRHRAASLRHRQAP
jgi:hypothetical protein